VFNLVFDNGESKFAPPRIDCRRTSDGSNKCHHARTDPIVWLRRLAATID